MGELDSLVIRNYARQLLCGLRHLHEHLLYMDGVQQEDVLLAGRGKVKLSNVHSSGLSVEIHSKESREKLAKKDLGAFVYCGTICITWTTSYLTESSTYISSSSLFFSFFFFFFFFFFNPLFSSSFSR